MAGLESETTLSRLRPAQNPMPDGSSATQKLGPANQNLVFLEAAGQAISILQDQWVRNESTTSIECGDSAVDVLGHIDFNRTRKHRNFQQTDAVG